MSKLLVIFFLLYSPTALSSICELELDHLPLRQGGRVKPYYVHSREMIKHLVGQYSVRGIKAQKAYCLLSTTFLGASNNIPIQTKVEHIKLRKTLNLTEQKEVLLDDLLADKDRLQAQWRLEKEQSSYKKALNGLLNKIHLYQTIISGKDWTMPVVEAGNVKWRPLNDTQIMSLFHSQTKDKLQDKLKQMTEKYHLAEKNTIQLELIYSKLRLPLVCLLLGLLGLAFLTALKKWSLALGTIGISLTLQTIYIAMRVIISGRAPITNMYETVMFSGYGALLLSMIIGHFKQEKVFVFVGLVYNVLTLMMQNFAGGMLNNSISPLVPVLRDNFWLSTHVTTVILSYGALALSWILANTVMIKKKFFQLPQSEEQYNAELIYTCLKFGTTMLGAGVLLGGVWADYSWGRFWGWDPKETWSLIVFALYMAILHGRYTSWIPNHRFVPLVSVAFLSVMMAWFGVNYILASGLHSYGFSEGGAIFLASFFVIQLAITTLCLGKFKKGT